MRDVFSNLSSAVLPETEKNNPSMNEYDICRRQEINKTPKEAKVLFTDKKMYVDFLTLIFKTCRETKGELRHLNFEVNKKL